MRGSDIVVTSVTIKHRQIKPKRIIKGWHMMGSNKIATNVSIKQHKKVIWKVTASMMCFISSEVRGPSLLFFSQNQNITWGPNIIISMYPISLFLNSFVFQTSPLHPLNATGEPCLYWLLYIRFFRMCFWISLQNGESCPCASSNAFLIGLIQLR